MAGGTTARRGTPFSDRSGPAARKGTGAPKPPKPPKGPKAPKAPKPAQRSGPQGPGARLRRGPVLASLAAAVVLAAGGTWVLYGSSWLRVEKVAATGMDVLTSEQVLGAAAVPVGAPW